MERQKEGREKSRNKFNSTNVYNICNNNISRNSNVKLCKK